LKEIKHNFQNIETDGTFFLVSSGSSTDYS